jgi:hypothetical protein
MENSTSTDDSKRNSDAWKQISLIFKYLIGSLSQVTLSWCRREQNRMHPGIPWRGKLGQLAQACLSMEFQGAQQKGTQPLIVHPYHQRYESFSLM